MIDGLFMKISWYEENKRIGRIKVGECFCLSDIGEFYIKTSDGSCVCLNDGQVTRFNDDVIVSPVELKATAVRKMEGVPIEPLDK